MTPLSINPPSDPLTPTVVADLARDCHADSVSKGWWEPLDTPAEEAAREAMRADLIGSEVGEALDALRRPERPLAYLDDKGKPDGYLVEVADVAIRALDLLGRVDGRLHYDVTAGAIKDGKSTAADTKNNQPWQRHVWRALIYNSETVSDASVVWLLATIVFHCANECTRHNADLLHFIQIKRDYNRTRQTRHGGMAV